MRFPIGCPVPVGVWRETPPPPDSLSSPKRKGRERRQGSPHATHPGPLAPAFLPFAVFLTNVRAVGPPPHCRLSGSHAFTLLNFQFLNLVLLATVSQISVIRDQEAGVAAFRSGGHAFFAPRCYFFYVALEHLYVAGLSACSTPSGISPTLRDELLEAARLVPSSFNSQPYRLFWVSSCDSLRMIAQCVSASRLPKPHPLWLLPSRISAHGALPPSVSSSGCVPPAFRPRKSPSSSANPSWPIGFLFRAGAIFWEL